MRMPIEGRYMQGNKQTFVQKQATTPPVTHSSKSGTECLSNVIAEHISKQCITDIEDSVE